MVTVDASHFSSSFRKWDEGRPAPSQNQTLNCPVAQVRSSPPLTVARALRESCNIPFESFFLATHLGNGKFAYFSGPRPISEDNIRIIFRRDKFLQIQNRPSSSGSAPPTYEDDYADGSYSDYTTVVSYGQWRESRSRKRVRRQGGQRLGLDDDAPPVIVSPNKALEIGNSAALWEFYDRGFKCIQQTACKEIAKAFVKIIAPKKQANNPYTKGDAAAPDWWPAPWGPGEKDRARHVEPDHMWKKERVHLLKHILRLIIDPSTQPPSMQKLEGLTVAKMETVAFESLTVWFEDKKKPENAMKKPILKEIFKIAKMEERYKRNEIDGATQVYVTADDMIMGFYCDEDAQADDEEEARAMAAESARAELATSAAPPTMPSVSSTGNHVHDLAAQFQSAPFLSQQYSQPAMLPPSLSPEQYSYPDGQSPLQPATTLQLHGMPHDTSRRSSLFTPTSDFSSSSYHTAAWSQSPPPASHGTPTTSAAASPEASSPIFTYGPHPHPHHYHPQQQQPQTVLPPPPALPLPMPMPHHHHHHHHSQSHHHHHQQPGPYVYDTPLTHHQQQQQVEFRGGSINLAFRPHQQQQQQQGYENYLPSHSHHHHHQHQEAVGGSPVSRG